MQLTKTDKYLICGAAITCTVAFGLYIKYQIDLLIDFCYDLKNFRINNFEKGNLSTTSTLRVKNQSNLDIIVLGYNIDVFLDKFKISNIKSEKPVIWKSNTISDIPINLDVELLNSGVSFLDSLNLFNLYITDKSKVVFTFKGYAVIKIFNRIPFRKYFQLQGNLADLLSDTKTPTTCKMD